MVPPGSVQREQHSWARGPATRWAAPGQQGGAWCFLCRGGRWPGTGQVRKTSLVPRPGWARSLQTETPDPSRTFPEPAAGVRGRWGKGLRKQSCHTQSHTDTEKSARSHVNRRAHVDTHVFTHTHRHKHWHTRALTHTGRHTRAHVLTHAPRHALTGHTDTVTHTLTHRYVPSDAQTRPHMLTGDWLSPAAPPLGPSATHTCRPLCLHLCLGGSGGWRRGRRGGLQLDSRAKGRPALPHPDCP